MSDPRHPPFITVSLKDALKIRPDAADSRDRIISRALATIPQKNRNLTIVTGNGRSAPADRKFYGGSTAVVTCQPMWRMDDFKTFDNLTSMACSVNPVDRAVAEDLIRQFMRKHGAEKCDMMLAEIRRRDAASWFGKEKNKGETQC